MVEIDGSAEGTPSMIGARACASECSGGIAVGERNAPSALEDAPRAGPPVLRPVNGGASCHSDARRAAPVTLPTSGLDSRHEAPADVPGRHAAHREQNAPSAQKEKPRPQRARRKTPNTWDTGGQLGLPEMILSPTTADAAAPRDSLPSTHGAPSHAGAESELLRAIYEEVRGLRHEVRELQSKPSNAAPLQAARAVSIDTARALLGCGRSRIFELLRSGTLRRAPKMGKVAMVSAASLEALLEGLHREPVPKLKRKPPAQRDAGRKEKAAILKLIRRA